MAITSGDTSANERLLVYRIKQATLLVRTAHLQHLLRKAGFRPDQPRVPAGNPDGGNGSMRMATPISSSCKPIPTSFRKSQRIPPPGTRERNTIAVRVAMFLLATNSGMQAERIRQWVWQHARDRIVAYLDEPKFLDELQRAVAEPKPGYDIHHIVEQTPARLDGLSPDRIDGWRNLVRIPTYKHWQITGWYGRPNPVYGNVSPRDFLRGKSWQERYDVGLDALRLFEVLK